MNRGWRMPGGSGPGPEERARKEERTESGDAARTASTAKFEGALEGLGSDAVTGWAWDANRPYEAVAVELYCGDILLGQGTADKFDIALAKANRGNGMHRFEIRLDRVPTKPPPFTVRAIVAGTDIELSPSLSVSTLDEVERVLAGSDYIGEVTEISNGAVCGWVLNRRNPHDAPVVTLRDGNHDVFTQTAADRTARVLDSGVTATAFRFELPLPQNLLDGKLHTLTVVAGPDGRTLGSPLLFGATDISSISRMLVSVGDRVDQLERRLEALRPAWDFAQFEKRVTSKVVEPVDMLLNVHRDSVEREMAVFRRQITEIIRRIPDIDLDFLAPSTTPAAIEDVTLPSAAAFDPIDRSQPMASFDLSTRTPLVQPHGDVKWISKGTGISLGGNGAIELEAPLGDNVDVLIRGSGVDNASELSALVIGFNGRPMSGRFDVFADGQWAFIGGAIEGGHVESPARPTIAFDYLTGISRPSGRLRISEISFFAPGRAPSRVEASAPKAAIVNLGRESGSAGWHPVEPGGRGGICWMGERSDVSVSLHATGAYSVSIPEIRPLVADLMPKLQMFLDGDPVSLEIVPMANDPSAYSAHGTCEVRNGTQETHTLRISFPTDVVKSPMELGLNPDLRPLSIAVRCIMLAAAAS